MIFLNFPHCSPCVVPLRRALESLLQSERKRKDAERKRLRNMERVHRAANGLDAEDEPTPRT